MTCKYFNLIKFDYRSEKHYILNEQKTQFKLKRKRVFVSNTIRTLVLKIKIKNTKLTLCRFHAMYSNFTKFRPNNPICPRKVYVSGTG